MGKDIQIRYKAAAKSSARKWKLFCTDEKENGNVHWRLEMDRKSECVYIHFVKCLVTLPHINLWQQRFGLTSHWWTKALSKLKPDRPSESIPMVTSHGNQTQVWAGIVMAVTTSKQEFWPLLHAYICLMVQWWKWMCKNLIMYRSAILYSKSVNNHLTLGLDS